MKISYQTGVNSSMIKEADFTVEDCPKNGGHCFVEFQSNIGYGNSSGSWLEPKTRTCKHCGLKERLSITPAVENWESL